MRLEKIRIENFRSFKDEAVLLDPYTCLVGPNGAGKSTILTALNVFFRNTSSSPTNVLILSREDFHHGNTQDPVRITLTFTELSAEGQKELSHYYRQGRLVVSAVARWNEKTETADVKQYGIRTVMKPFAPYFALAERKAKATELQECYDQIREQFPDLPVATTGPKREVALREFEESRPELCEPHEAETQFYGFTRGSNLLDKYIQWVYVPAVKDASSEQDEGGKGALKTLLDRTVRGKVNFKEPIATLKKQVEDDYQKIIDSQKEVLESLQISMRARLREWASPDAELTLGWHRDDRSIVVNEPYARAAIGEDDFLGDVARLGHGMQRSFLVAILQELASTEFEHSPTLLLGIEEPELYQHPPQAHHIAQVMENLATRAETNTQVLLSTHSPHFVPTKGFASVRLVRKHPVDKCSLVASTTYEKVESVLAKALGDPPDKPTVTMATIEQIMQPSQKELYFCKVAVLVEGPEDVGYIATHLLLTKKWDEFRKLGCHFIVAGGKTNMSRPLAIANELCIPTFVVFDADTDKHHREDQTKSNSCLLKISGNGDQDPLSCTNLFLKNCVVWSKRIADTVRTEAGKQWDIAHQDVSKAYGFLHGTSKKNKLYVACIVEQLGRAHFISESLTKLCDHLLRFAAKHEVDDAGETQLCPPARTGGEAV